MVPLSRQIVLGSLALAGLLVGIGLFLRAGSTQGFAVIPAPLRELSTTQRYELRVLYLEDPRLPALEAEQRRQLYAKIERLLAEWYDFRVGIREVGVTSPRRYFSEFDGVFDQYRSVIRAIDLDPDNPLDEQRIRSAIARDFAPRELAMIARYFGGKPIASKADAVNIAYDAFLPKLREIRAIPVRDGTAFFDRADARLTSYVHWCVVLRETKQADFLLTNSMILGADAEMPIYAIARGGVSTGIVNNNLHNPFQAATAIGLFPFLSDAPSFQGGGGPIPDAEVLDVIATFAMHELGHFFLRHAEHYDHVHCVHVAPPSLDYYTWHKAVRDGGPCRLPHQKVRHF